MTKQTGLYLVGAAVVAGILYSVYRLAKPNTATINNTPNNVSSSVAVPFNNLLYGPSGLVPLLFPGDIANTTDTAQTNPGVV